MYGEKTSTLKKVPLAFLNVSFPTLHRGAFKMTVHNWLKSLELGKTYTLPKNCTPLDVEYNTGESSRYRNLSNVNIHWLAVDRFKVTCACCNR